MKVIKICLEEYQTMIRKVRTKFASKIQKFKKFKKFMKKRLLNTIAYAIL